MHFFLSCPYPYLQIQEFLLLGGPRWSQIQPFLVNSTSRPRCPLRCGSIYNLHEPLLPDCFLTSNTLFLKQPCFLESTFEHYINWVILELWRNGIPWASNRKGMEPGPNDISMTKIPRALWNVCVMWFVIWELGFVIVSPPVTMCDTALWQCVTQFCDNDTIDG